MDTPTATDTPTASTTPTDTATPTGTATASETPTGTPLPSETPTSTAAPTETPTSTAAPTETPTSTAHLVLNPISGTVQQAVIITGSGFLAGETVGIYLDSTSSMSITTQAGPDGSFVLRSTVPRVPGGWHIVIAVGQASHRTARALFQLMPSLDVWPAGYRTGAFPIVIGFGFRAGEVIVVHWATASGPPLGATVADATGSFYDARSVVITVPQSPAGVYPLVAVGSSGHSVASTPFVIPPTGLDLSVTPTRGKPGSTALVSGKGFDPQERVYLYFCSQPFCTDGQALTGVTADGQGTFSAVPVQIPPTATGQFGAVVGIGTQPTHLIWTPFTLTP